MLVMMHTHFHMSIIIFRLEVTEQSEVDMGRPSSISEASAKRSFY